MSSERRRLIVTGFHRSGTSAAAHLLHDAGLDMGSDLVGRRASNPDGHFEDVAAVRLHDLLLSAADADWMTGREDGIAVDESGQGALSQYVATRDARSSQWGVKDPRATHFLAAWRTACDPCVLGMVRRPEAVVESLRTREARRLRNGHAASRRLFADPDHVLRMWMAANTNLLSYEGDRLVVTFESLGDGYPLVSAVRRRFELDLGSVETFAVVTPIRPGADSPAVRADGVLLDQARDLYRRLERESLEVANVR